MKESGYGRYGVDFNKLVRQLVPHWLRGKNLVLFLQACVHPLQSVADAFSDWANDVRIETSMTSQKIMLEWYLGYKFGGTFEIVDYKPLKNACYYLKAATADKYTMPCFPSSSSSTAISKINAVHYIDEDNVNLGVSFVVRAPLRHQNIKDEIARVVNRYKIVNKTYKIEFV